MEVNMGEQMPKDMEKLSRESDQFRANMLTFNTLLRLLKDNGVTDAHWAVMKNTPFWTLLNTYTKGLVTDAYYKKYDSNLIAIINQFDIKSRSFRLGRGLVDFTPDHVSQILGIPNIGGQIEIHKREIAKYTFIRKYFNTNKQLSKKKVEDALVVALKGNKDEDLNDVVRLIVLHLCVSFFFANTGNSLGWVFAKYIHDIPKIKKYNWAAAIHTWLIDSLMKKMKYNHSSTVTGCVPLLLFWFCEVTNAIKPIQERKDLIPRFLRWDIQALNKKITNIDMDMLKVSPHKLRSSVSKSGKHPLIVVVDEDSDEDFVDASNTKGKEHNVHFTSFDNNDDGFLDEVISLSETPNPKQINKSPLNTPVRTMVENKDEVFELEEDMDKQLVSGGDYDDIIPKTLTFERDLIEIERREYEIYGTPMQTSEYVECLEENNEDLEDAIRKLQSKVGELQEEMDVEKKKLQEELLRQTTKTVKLEKRLDFEIQQQKELYSRMREMTNERNWLRLRVDKLMESNSSLSSKAEGHRENITRLNSQLSVFQSEIERQNETSNRVIGDKNEEIAQLKCALVTLERDYAQIKDSDEKWKKMTAELKDECAEKITEYDRIVSDLQKHIDHLSIEATKLSELEENHRRLISKHVKDLDDQRRKLNCSHKQNKDLWIHNNTLRIIVEQLGGDPDCPNSKILCLKTRRNRVPNKKPEYSYQTQIRRSRKRRDKNVVTLPDSHPTQKKNRWCVKDESKEIDEGVHISDEYTDTPRSAEIRRKIPNPIKADLYHLLDRNTQEKIRVYYEKAPLGTLAWQLDHDSISLSDISDLLWQAPISNNMIDCYTSILADQLKNDANVKNIYMSTYGWEEVKKKNNAGIKKFVYDIMLQNIRSCSKVFIPLRHDDDFHFTLLFLDKEQGLWYHCNPLNKTMESITDRCYNEAKQMHSVIQKFLRDARKYGEKMLQKNTNRKITRNLRGNPKSYQLTTKEHEDTIRWMMREDEYFPLYKYPECPQQEPGTYDCGVAVMYFIRELSTCNEFSKDYTPEVLLDMRAHLTDVFLNHKYSWNYNDMNKTITLGKIFEPGTNEEAREEHITT